MADQVKTINVTLTADELRALVLTLGMHEHLSDLGERVTTKFKDALTQLSNPRSLFDRPCPVRPGLRYRECEYCWNQEEHPPAIEINIGPAAVETLKNERTPE